MRQVDELLTPVERAQRALTTRWLDFVLFLAVPLESNSPHGIPVNEIAAIGIVILAAFRRPVFTDRPKWFANLLWLLIGWLFLVTYFQHLEPIRRMGHLMIWTTLILVLSSGRIHIPSAARGMAASFIAVLVVGVLKLDIPTLTGYEYAGRLDGLVHDPNAGGMALVACGAAATGFLAHRWYRITVAIVVTIAVFLTFSRTSWLALAFVGLWVVLLPRLGRLAAAAMPIVFAVVVARLPTNHDILGLFKDRQSSDALRRVIYAQERELIAIHPWTGNGLGTAIVTANGHPFYFHSSYQALRAEGGWIALALYLSVIVALGWAHAARVGLRDAAVSGAVGALLISGINLGEVFLTIPAATAIGFAMYRLLQLRRGDAIGLSDADQRTARYYSADCEPADRHGAG